MKKSNLKLSLLSCLILFTYSNVFGQAKKYIKACKPIQKEYYVEIPVENRGGHLFIKVVINNKEYTFLLDTAAPSSISKEIASELKLDTIYTDILTGADNVSGSEYYAIVPLISIGDLVYQNVFATINDYSVFGTFTSCNNWSGIIGTDILKNGVCRFTDKSIILTDKVEKLNLSVEGSDLILTKRYNPILELKFQFGENHLDFLKEEMMFDSGANDFIHWSKASLDVVYNAFPKKPELIKGVGNSYRGAYSPETHTENKERAVVNRIEIGGVAWKDIECYISNDQGSLIGSKMLDLMNLTIDWKKKKYYITKKGEIQNSEFGFIYSSEGFITELWDNSPLKKDKVELGAKIISINGNKLSEMSECDIAANRYDILRSEKIELLIDGRDKPFYYIK